MQNQLISSEVQFQFTHPGRGATIYVYRVGLDEEQFQFTHPGRGATSTLELPKASYYGFNSRTPGGVRREEKEVKRL